ncbi:MAG: tetratricopeptide repeat protein [Vulcanimicrobiaceae bacterium]
MFDFFRRFARSGPRTPLDAALEALSRGDHPRALAALEALLAQPDLERSQRVIALNKRGVLRVGLHDHGAARGDFEAALALDPAYAPAHANLGNLLYEEARYEEAILRYEAAIRADDAYATAYVNVAAAYKRLGRHAQAVGALRKAARLEGRLPLKPSKSR